MTIMMRRSIQTPGGTMIMTFAFFDQLLRSNSEIGRLTREHECHALWYYYCIATKAYNDAQMNIVDEEDRSRIFDRETARNMFGSVANMYGVSPAAMVRFWPIIHQQRIAMGGVDGLPDQFKFAFWGN